MGGSASSRCGSRRGLSSQSAMDGRRNSAPHTGTDGGPSRASLRALREARARVAFREPGAGRRKAAIDLHEHGARVAMSVRSPVNIVPRDILGLPILAVSIVLSRLPARLADVLAAPLLGITIGDVTRLGFRKAPVGPITQIRTSSRIPLIDVGTVQLVREGLIEVVGGVRSMDVIATAARCVTSRLRHFSAGSPQYPAETGSLSYGPTVRFRLLPTPSCDDAVTFSCGAVANSDRDLHPANSTLSRAYTKRLPPSMPRRGRRSAETSRSSSTMRVAARRATPRRRRFKSARPIGSPITIQTRWHRYDCAGSPCRTWSPPNGDESSMSRVPWPSSPTIWVRTIPARRPR
jgi:hypothetical protein